MVSFTDRPGKKKGRGAIERPDPAARDKALLKSILERLVIDDTEPFVIVSLSGPILFANPAYHQLSGRCSWALPMEGEDLNRGPQEVPLADAVAEMAISQRPMRFRQTLSVDGDDRLYVVRVLPVYDDFRRLTAAVALYKDTSSKARQAAMVSQVQDQFRDFARATSDWFWELDENFCIRVISDRFTALTGLPVFDFVGQPLSELGTFQANLEGANVIDRALERRTPFRDQLLRVETRKGVLRFHLSGVPIFDRESGRFRGFRGAAMNQTERYKNAAAAREAQERMEKMLSELKAKNVELDKATARAENALTAQNDFLAAMSHELRTPLNAIIGFADSIKMKLFGDISDSYLDYVDQISGAGQHLLSLINDILEVSVIENGDLKIDCEPVSLDGVVKQSLSLAVGRVQGEKAPVDVTKVTEAGLPPVMADERRLVQILVNLLTNAMKFTPQDGQISLSAREEQEALLLDVRDTGCGIPEEDRERIFEKFQQAGTDAYVKSSDGAGLGLHISRELARAMGGDVVLDTMQHQGSCFTVRLRRAADGL